MSDKNRKLFWKIRNTICGYGSNYRAKLMWEMEDRLWILLGGDA